MNELTLTPEQIPELIIALQIYIPAASPHQPDNHIVVIEQLLAQLKTHVPAAPDDKDLFNDAI
jgi:hypothetical protein